MLEARKDFKSYVTVIALDYVVFIYLFIVGLFES